MVSKEVGKKAVVHRFWQRYDEDKDATTFTLLS
jgi:hypothetical protein